MKKILFIFLLPLCLLAGIGLFQIIFRLFGETVSFLWQIVIGGIFGILLCLVEGNLIYKFISNWMKQC